MQETWVWSLGGEDPLEEWMETSPGESHGQGSLVGYSPWARKELDMTEHVCMYVNTSTILRAVSVSICLCVNVSMCKCVYMCLYMYVYICVYMFVYVCVYICMCIFVFVYVCVYVFVYVYIYLYVYVYMCFLYVCECECVWASEGDYIWGQ